MKRQGRFGAYFTGSPQNGFLYGVSTVSMEEPAGVDAALEDAGFPHAARVKQVHGDRVVEYAQARAATQEADAIFLRSGEAGVIRVADCVPIVLLAPKRQEAVVIHAGWRGTHARIVEKSLRLLGEPADVFAYIGPAIGGCCYEVDVALAEKFQVEFGAGPWILPPGTGGRLKPHLDLQVLNRSLLKAAGVGSIEVETACTYEDQDLHSFRRDADRAGRIGAFVAIDR